MPEKAFSGVFALQKRRNPFSFSVFSLRVKVYYKYDGYLSRISKSQIDEEIEEHEADNRRIYVNFQKY